MKAKSILKYIIIMAISYVAVTFIMSATTIAYSPDKESAIIEAFTAWWWLKLIIGAIVCLIAKVMLKPPLNVQAVKVGHGQHGDARWMEPDERDKNFLKVPFGKEKEPGFLVGLEHNVWIIDNSDQNMMLLAPPGAGKTTAVYIPCIEYNARVNKNTAGQGANMLIVDIKGTLYKKTAALLQDAGYKTPCIELREVYQSAKVNLLHNVNREIDSYKAAENPKEKATFYGRAERYAKIVSDSIFAGKSTSVSSEGSDYFNNSAKSLVTGIILMVSEYAPPSARHIMSVFDIIVSNCEAEDSGVITGVQKTKLAAMLDKIPNKRIKNYVGAATGADIRTTLNVFSSAIMKLSDFIDAELEQLMNAHSPELEAQAFIDSPTAIFIICPDDNPTRHFMASLFIRSFANDLIELTERKYEGTMPRPLLFFWDEFGNLPSISHVDTIFSAFRSRGGRILCALQSYAQLLDKYSKEKAKIIEDTCQMLMYSFVAPSAEDTANRISKMLGNETVLSGSTSVSRGVTTTSQQMIGRPLMAPSNLVTMPFGTFITYKATMPPYKAELQGYWKYLDLGEERLTERPQNEYEDVVIATPRYIETAASGQQIELWKGMFEHG